MVFFRENLLRDPLFSQLRCSACFLPGKEASWSMITVETTDASVRVTIPKSEVPADRLNWFVDSLRFEAIARRSHLTEDEASLLADEIKAGWWSANRHRFAKPAQ
jgi:hypothetical protein